MIGLVAEALSQLAANATRTVLTMLGLVIGVAAVISVQVIGAALAGSVASTLGNVSDRSFTIIPNARQADFVRARIRFEDIEHVRRDLPNITEGVPIGVNVRFVRVGHEHARIQVGAESESRYSNVPIRYGRGFDESDISAGSRVCILASTAYERLFPGGGDPTGTTIEIGEHRYLVVGVLQKQNGFSANFGRSDISLPYTTYERDLAKGAFLYGARFFVDDVIRMPETESSTNSFFTKIKGGRVRYQTIDKQSLAIGIAGIVGALTFLVACIAGVSLAVAGIGILNVMLVSVTERTREIGIRKAIGAKKGQILAQFFLEALILSSVGSGIGLLLGVGIGAEVNNFAIVKLAGVLPAIPWFTSIAIAIGFAVIVTTAFGTYPAWRAAQLDPIEALRYE